MVQDDERGQQNLLMRFSSGKTKEKKVEVHAKVRVHVYVCLYGMRMQMEGGPGSWSQQGWFYRCNLTG